MTERADRRLISSGAPWEATVGYSRAVRAGALVFVAGTTAVDERGEVIGDGDPYRQAKAVLGKIEAALAQAGASIRDVVRTRIFVTDIAFAEQVGRAHGESFAHIKPASTLVQVVRLIDPRLLVEIEADAIARE
ncbi:MAG TPA: RidA family protein [Candidatus Eremiobacteraceae bacterium]|nr:RidA family protein [Candidatus Eremiobacteraceae bacterium]